MSLTEKKLQRYLKTSDHCPYCNSESIGFYDIEMTDTNYKQEVACQKCGRHWFNVLSITSLEEKEETEEDVVEQLKELLTAFVANATTADTIQTVLLPTLSQMMEVIGDYLESTEMSKQLREHNATFLAMLREFKAKLEQFE